MLEITHTVTEGTLLDGTSRGDGTAELIKPLGWRWGRSISCWYLPRSRDQRADPRRIEATRATLADAGFAVTVTVDDTMPATADLEQAKRDRQEQRVERLTDRAARATAAADAADQAAHRAVQQLPPGGEPIKVGHHSEARHRRALDTADRSIRKSIEADNTARRAQTRLDAAASTTSNRYAPRTVANRIHELDADLRRVQRRLDGYTDGHGVYATQIPAATGGYREQLLEERDQLNDNLAYWRQIRAHQISDGTATNYTQADIAPGDQVSIGSQWRTVVRANKTTVSVDTGYSWTERARYSDIRDHRRPGSQPSNESPPA